MVSRNSIPGGFAYIRQSKWLGIIAIKTESTKINFLSDVLVAVARRLFLNSLQEVETEAHNPESRLYVSG